MSNQRGFIPIIVVLVVIGVIVSAIALIQTQHHVSPSVKSSPSPSPTPTIMPSPQETSSASLTVVKTNAPSATPLIDCTGPDGKHAQMTQKDCDALNQAWAKPPSPSPLPSASPSQSGSASSTGSTNNNSGPCATGQVTVSLAPNNGPVVGDALIDVSIRQQSSPCFTSFASQDILRQGTPSINYANLTPGVYNLIVGYHGNQTDDSFTITPGSNVSKSVNVTN